MQIITPERIGVMHASVAAHGRWALAVTGMLAFDIDDSSLFLPTRQMWEAVRASLDTHDILDLWIPKSAGEVLLWGDAVSPHPVARMEVSLRCGSIHKRLIVHGDRQWEPTLLGWTPGAAQPFRRRPLRWRDSYGGEGFDICQIGKGFQAERRLNAGEACVEIANLELPGQELLHPSDEGALGGLGALNPAWWAPGRNYHSAMMVIGEPTQATLPPQVALAPPGQSMAGFWQGGEEIALSGFREEGGLWCSRLPAVRMRCFSSVLGAADLRSCEMQADTVCLFPAKSMGIVLYRGLILDVGVDARKLGTLMLAAEWRDRPRTDAHYLREHSLRTAKATRIDHMLNDSPLMPELAAAHGRAMNAERRASVQVAEAAQAQRQAFRVASASAAMGVPAADIGLTGRLEGAPLAGPPIVAAEHETATVDLPAMTAAHERLERDTLATLELSTSPPVAPLAPFSSAYSMTAQLADLAERIAHTDEPIHLLLQEWARRQDVTDSGWLDKAFNDQTDDAQLQAAIAPLDDGQRVAIAAALNESVQAINSQHQALHGLVEKLKSFEANSRALDTGKGLNQPDPVSMLEMVLMQVPDDAMRRALGLPPDVSGLLRSDPMPDAPAQVQLPPEISQHMTGRNLVGLLDHMRGQQGMPNPLLDALNACGLQKIFGVIGSQSFVSAGGLSTADRAQLASELDVRMAQMRATGAWRPCADHVEPPTGAVEHAAGDYDPSPVGDELAELRSVAHAQPLIPPQFSKSVIDAETSRSDELPNGRNLSGKDLSGQDLSGRDLRGVDLRGALLERSNLKGADLRGANMSAAVLVGANLVGADLSAAILEKANLSGATAMGSKWDSADLGGANLTQANLSDASLVKTHLLGCNLEEACLDRADLSGSVGKGIRARAASLKSALLWDIEWPGADLCAAIVEGCSALRAVLDGALMVGLQGGQADFGGASLRGANLIDARLPGLIANRMCADHSSWEAADLRSAQFEGASLEEAIFVDARMDQARCSCANLKGAALSGAVLREAEFCGAQLFGAALRGTQCNAGDFRGANLRRADFTGADVGRCDLTDADVLNTLLMMPDA